MFRVLLKVLFAFPRIATSWAASNAEGKDAECAAAACPAKAGQVLQLVAPFQSKVSSTNEAAPSIGPRGHDGWACAKTSTPRCPGASWDSLPDRESFWNRAKRDPWVVCTRAM